MRSAEAILGELEVFGIRLGLESTTTLLAAFGDPQRRYRVILVAGTNGKGSTSSLLASILHAAGLRTALYTSPHLEDVTERIRVAGRVIDAEVLARRLERVVEVGRVALGHPPTYFEAITVAAYWHLAEENVEVAVMEVGLGGRLDATNAADPVLSIVTGIALDHMKVLGTTLDSIAREKAGVLRAGRSALHGVEPPAARAALEEEARRVGAELLDAAALASVVDEGGSADGERRVLLRTPTAEHRFAIGMRGAYQARNLRLGVLAAEILRDEQELPIDAAAIERGVGAWRWPGRCEIVTLPQGRQVLLDAAHNEEGIASLRAELAGGWPGDARASARPWRLVFGALDDKPATAMLSAIASGAERVILVKPPSPRGVDPRELLAALPAGTATIAADSAHALDLALADGGERVVICGSIYLVGDARQQLRSRFGVPPPATDPWYDTACGTLGPSSSAAAAPTIATR